jgi:hypothetical protein
MQKVKSKWVWYGIFLKQGTQVKAPTCANAVSWGGLKDCTASLLLTCVRFVVNHIVYTRWRSPVYYLWKLISKRRGKWQRLEEDSSSKMKKKEKYFNSQLSVKRVVISLNMIPHSRWRLENKHPGTKITCIHYTISACWGFKANISYDILCRRYPVPGS